MRTAAIFAGPEEGGRRRELRKAGGLWTLEEARETDSPLEPLQRNAPLLIA